MAMNVNRVEHQRSVLAALGIDIWMPKSGVQARSYQNTLYRDVVMPEALPVVVVPEINFQAAIPLATMPDQQVMRQADVTILRVDENSQPSNTIRPLQNIKETAKELKNDIELSTLLKIDAFELQAYCLEHCVLVINATQLSAEQLQLWRNIRTAKIGTYAELKWPFPLLQFQDARGAYLYIQGFLDALTQDKQVLGLGEIPHWHNQKIIALASLQDMLDQPILKKRLWQFMQN
ncbi:hypothetical protein [Acinetobacter silvestris]|uniref:Uncharacterized protein n=1 Tax=Acinetobacter silvestris TaxID=1977882 RepID=A0A1Y3CFZ0_9GAMM|nr:hypothetical protein [Acinetobacter silvestris]OTG66009.1 hypothetical protein B9T28_07375 [Acinetobacter silvestris]